MTEVSILLIAQYILKLIRHFIYIDKIPPSCLMREEIVGDSAKVPVVSIIFIGLCIFLIIKKEKAGYFLAWCISALSIFSVFSYGLYFHVVVNEISAGFIALNILLLFVGVKTISRVRDLKINNFFNKKIKA